MLTVRRALVKHELEFYVRWLEYVPEKWEINRLLDKKVKNLKPEEFNLLLQINNDMLIAKYLKGFIEIIKTSNNNKVTIINISTEDDDKISNIIKTFDIDYMAHLKLNQEDIDKINQIVEKSDLDKEILNEIDNFSNPYVRDYARVLINKKEASVEKSNVKRFKIAK